MTRAKPRTIAAGTTALCHLQDAQACLRVLATGLDVDGVQHDYSAIVELWYKIRAVIDPLNALVEQLKKGDKTS